MFNWRELPFVRLLVPLIAGILLSCFFQFNSKILVGMLLLWPLLLWAAAKIRGLYRYRWLFGALMYLGAFQLGYQTTRFYDERNASDYFGNNISQTEQITVGTVDDAPIQKGNWVRLEVGVEQTGPTADSLQIQSGNLLLYVARDSISEGIAYGDRLFFQGRLNEVEPPGNPNSFDYRRYLHFKNIHHQAFVRAGDWQVLDSGNGNWFFATAIDLQGQFLNTLRKQLDTPNEFAVGSALILGYRDEIPEEVQMAYSQTGAMHVLAVSGLHVGIVFLILNFFLQQVKLQSVWWRLTKVVIILVGIWTFALVTGASPSVTRAAVMFSFLNVGLALRRDANVYNTFAVSAFLLLLWKPYLLASVSFQLSYLAVFGIVFFQPRFARQLYVPNQFLNYCWQLVCVSLAAQLMLVPLTFLYFHQFPTYFWLTSLLLVPLAGFELGAGLLLLLLEAIWPVGAEWAGKLLWGMLKLGNEFVLLVQSLPAAVFDGIWIGGAVVALLYLALGSSMMAIASRKFRWVVTGLAFLLAVSVNYAFTEWNRHEARQVVIYDIYKHTAIDFFDGKTVYSITDAGIDEKSLGFATEGHRFKMGMDDLYTWHLADPREHVHERIFFDRNFIQFHDLRMYVLDGPTDFQVTEKIKLDYLLVSGSPKVFIEEILSVFKVGEIIFDSSNKRWQVEKWKAKCEELGVEFYVVDEEGAFVLDLP